MILVVFFLVKTSNNVYFYQEQYQKSILGVVIHVPIQSILEREFGADVDIGLARTAISFLHDNRIQNRDISAETFM